MAPARPDESHTLDHAAAAMLWIRPFLPRLSGIDVVLATGPAATAGAGLTVILGVGRWAGRQRGARLAPDPALVRRLLRRGAGVGVAELERRVGMPAARGPAHQGRLYAWRLGAEPAPPLFLLAAFRRSAPGRGFGRSERELCNRVAVGVAAAVHRTELLASGRADAGRVTRVLRMALDLNASSEPGAAALVGEPGDGEVGRALTALREAAARNARLIADSASSRRRADAAVERLRLAVEVAVDLASASPSAAEVSRRLLRGVGRAVSADHGLLCRVADAEAVVLDGFDAGGEPPAPGTRLPAGALPDPPSAPARGGPAPPRLVLGLPDAGDPPAVIALGRRGAEPFQPDDVAAAELLQGVGGLGLRNAMLFAAAEEARDQADAAVRSLLARGRQEEALAELGRVAVAGTAEDELLALAARSVAETLPAELVTIAEPAPPGRVRAVHGPAGHAARSRLRVPIGAGPHPMAELTALSPRPGAFGEEARDFALRVAQLLEDAMRHARGERALRESLANLGRAEASRRALVARVVQVAEEERGRIAADMHDDVLQAMAASALRLQLIREGAAVRDGPALDRLVAGLDRSMERLRDLVFELRTDALEEGLGRALERHLAHDAGPTALAHRVVDRLVREPAPGPRLTLYRIAQEALLNVRKHSHARTVEVSLEPDGDGVRMRVADDGRGFDPDVADGRAAGHIGLVAMRERASLAGGRVTVDSAPGRGTVVDVRVPAGPAP